MDYMALGMPLTSVPLYNGVICLSVVVRINEVIYIKYNAWHMVNTNHNDYINIIWMSTRMTGPWEISVNFA